MTRSPRFCAIYMMGESWLKSFEILKVHSKRKQSKTEKRNKEKSSIGSWDIKEGPTLLCHTLTLNSGTAHTRGAPSTS